MNEMNEKTDNFLHSLNTFTLGMPWQWWLKKTNEQHVVLHVVKI